MVEDIINSTYLRYKLLKSIRLRVADVRKCPASAQPNISFPVL